MLERVAQGACWTALRRHQEGYIASPICPRCRLQPEDEFHMFWGCRCNHEIEDNIIQETQQYSARATSDHHEQQSFWLRVLTPREWTQADTEPQYFCKVWGTFNAPWPIETSEQLSYLAWMDQVAYIPKTLGEEGWDGPQ